MNHLDPTVVTQYYGGHWADPGEILQDILKVGATLLSGDLNAIRDPNRYPFYSTTRILCSDEVCNFQKLNKDQVIDSLQSGGFLRQLRMQFHAMESVLFVVAGQKPGVGGSVDLGTLSFQKGDEFPNFVRPAGEIIYELSRARNADPQRHAPFLSAVSFQLLSEAIAYGKEPNDVGIYVVAPDRLTKRYYRSIGGVLFTEDPKRGYELLRISGESLLPRLALHSPRLSRFLGMDSRLEPWQALKALRSLEKRLQTDLDLDLPGIGPKSLAARVRVHERGPAWQEDTIKQITQQLAVTQSQAQELFKETLRPKDHAAVKQDDDRFFDFDPHFLADMFDALRPVLFVSRIPHEDFLKSRSYRMGLVAGIVQWFLAKQAREGKSGTKLPEGFALKLVFDKEEVAKSFLSLGARIERRLYRNPIYQDFELNYQSGGTKVDLFMVTLEGQVLNPLLVELARTYRPASVGFWDLQARLESAPLP